MLTRSGTQLLALAGMFLVAMLFSACDPDYPQCYNDENCAEKGEYCVNESCSQCRDDSQCAGDCTECNGARCDKIVGCCSPSVPCPHPQKCRNGVCGPECLSDAECPANHVCTNGSCVKLPDCLVDADCPAGHYCDKEVCKKIEVCQLKKIYFDFDEAAIRSDQSKNIEANATCIAERGLTDLLITGHCDERGTEEHNLKLGERRAKATKKALKKQGVDSDYMDSKSKGEYEPVVKNARSESDHQKNRRTETTIR